jgi:hypothetical protein
MLFDGQADVAGNLPQQRRSDVATFVKGSRNSEISPRPPVSLRREGIFPLAVLQF